MERGVCMADVCSVQCRCETNERQKEKKREKKKKMIGRKKRRKKIEIIIKISRKRGTMLKGAVSL